MKFAYKAYDRAGAELSNSVESRSIGEATESLRRQGLFVTEIRAAGEDIHLAKTPSGIAARFGKGRRLKNVAIFTRQLHVLISTGTPLAESLAALQRQARDPRFSSVIAGLRAKVEDGSSLASALAAYPQDFNALCRGLIAAGESGGNLDAMLDRLAGLTRKQLHVRNSIIGAMVYPILLIFVALGVLGTLLMFVLPRFALLFQSLDTPLPPTTKMLMGLSDFMLGYWWSIPIIVAGVAVGSAAWVKTRAGQHLIEVAALKCPRVGTMVRNFTTAQITRLLGILLNGKVPLVEALSLTRDSMANGHYSALLRKAEDAVTRGESLSGAFSETDLVPPAVYEAMRSGERSGQLGALLNTLADFLDEENDVTLRSLTSILEPMILMVLGVLVGFVAVSMFMPLFDLTAATRGG